jgi:hypothetical protein
MGLNTDIRKQVDDGKTTGVNITFPMGDYTPFEATSGYVPDGKYELEIKKFGLKEHPNDEQQVWAEMNFVVVGPDKWAGTPIRGSFLVPIQHADEDIEGKRRYACNFLNSVLSADPATYEAKLKQLREAGNAALNSDMFVGKRCYATTQTEQGKSNNKKYAKTEFFISREEYELRPGPAASIELETTGEPLNVGKEIMDDTGTGADAVNAAVAGSNGVDNKASANFTL